MDTETLEGTTTKTTTKAVAAEVSTKGPVEEKLRKLLDPL
jgi:hypothetical protein